MKKSFKLILLILIGLAVKSKAQDTVHYTGNTVVNVDYHHGQLSPAVGVHNMQIFRANRETGALIALAFLLASWLG